VRAARTILRSIAASLVALIASGCFSTLDIKDFEHLPVQKPLYRYTIAHRGSLHEGLPDNSLPALKESISRGVQFLEVDVRRGRDGTLFLFHDGSLRESNSSLPKDLMGTKIQELSAEERARVRLDSAASIGIPTLKEALDLLDKTNTASLQLDLKGESDELLTAVIRELRREKKLARAVIQLKDPARIRKIRRAEPRARILARVRDTSQLELAIASDVECIELERWISADAIRKAHAAHIVVVFNVAAPPYDKEETWSFFRARGIDSIMTDYATRAR